MLTKVRQLCSNQKLTANCYQKLTANCHQELTANCYQKLTAKCYQKFQSKVDSEMLSNVSVKSRHQKFQSKVDTESFSQKLTAKCNAIIIREVALRYCKQINNGRYQCNTHPVVSPAKDRSINSQAHTTRRSCEECYRLFLVSLSNRWMHDYKWKNKKVYQAWIFFLESIVASGIDVKIVIFPCAPGRCCKNKTKTARPEAIDCRRVSPPPPRQSNLYIPVPVFVAHVPL